MRRTVRAASTEETIRIARAIGERLRGGEVLALRGPLGAGKTTFAKGIAAGLSIDPRDVTSPTFLLIHEVRGRLVLRHVDAYRVESADELLELGAAELFGEDGVVVFEWPERAPEILPEARLTVDLSIPDPERNLRILEITAAGERHERLIAGVPAEVEP